jgi:hypothetical protein
MIQGAAIGCIGSAMLAPSVAGWTCDLVAMDLITRSHEYRLIDRDVPLLVLYGPWGVWSCGASADHWSEMIDFQYHGTFSHRHLIGATSAALSMILASLSGALMALGAATTFGPRPSLVANR